MPAAILGKISNWAGRATGWGKKSFEAGAKGIGKRLKKAPGAGFVGRHPHGVSAGAGFAYGYATSEGDFGERLQRGAAFGIGGFALARGMTHGGGMSTVKSLGRNVMGTVKGTGITANRVNPNATFRRTVQGYVRRDGQTYRRTIGFRAGTNRAGPRASMIPVSATEARNTFARGAAADAGKFFGIEKWTGGHSMMAGGLYGMASDDVGILEGMAGGGLIHMGGGMAARGISKGIQQAPAVGRAFKSDGMMAAFKEAKKMPFVRTATGLGIAMGAKSGMDSDEGMMGVVSGAVKGGLVGGGAATLGRAMAAAPLATMGVGVPGLIVAGGAAEAYTQFEAGGRVGFNSMEADGDLALALHKMRHGF